MRRGYPDKRPNAVKRASRPGVLTLALLIGLGFVYLASPTSSLLPVEADEANEALVMSSEEVTGQGEGQIENRTYDGNSDVRHRECIHVRSINGFNVIDNKHLTVSTGPKRTYLLTLWNRCHDLRFAHQIAIKSTGSWTCSHSRDVVITDDQRCMIDDIERVESHKAAKDLVEERKQAEEEVDKD